jgi:hypothetical protein
MTVPRTVVPRTVSVHLPTMYYAAHGRHHIKSQSRRYIEI